MRIARLLQIIGLTVFVLFIMANDKIKTKVERVNFEPSTELQQKNVGESFIVPFLV